LFLNFAEEYTTKALRGLNIKSKNASPLQVNNENIKQLWLQLNRKLKAFIINKIHDEEAAEDILQEVFIRIHANIDMLKDDSKLQAWIYQITRNLIADHFNNIKKENLFQTASEKEEEDSSTEYMSEALLDMVNMMDGLPPEYCEALCLTELGGMSQKMYAEKIGISYSGAKSRVQRAKIMLKDMLMKCCHYQFDKYGTVLEIHPKGCCCCEINEK
jgi:RNA polymerase sigma-70 factor (ECF subfamily)